MKRIGVIIAARGGSKGLPGKNTRLLNGKPLIDYSIELAQNLSNIKAIAVSSDSDDILKRGSYHGVTTILRPKALAQDNSMVVDAVIHASEVLNNIHNCEIDSILLLQPTFPIRDLQEIEESIQLFQKNPKSSVVSVEKMKEHPCECVEYIDNNPRNWAYLRGPKSVSNRQDYKGFFYFINGNFYISSLKKLKSIKTFIDESTQFYECKSRSGVDIDDLNDFEYAEYLISKKNFI